MREKLGINEDRSKTVRTRILPTMQISAVGISCMLKESM